MKRYIVKGISGRVDAFRDEAFDAESEFVIEFLLKTFPFQDKVDDTRPD